MSRLISLLVLIAFTTGALPEEPDRAGTARPVVKGVPASNLPDALLQHFRKQGIPLLAEASNDGRRKIWLIENLRVGPHCRVFTTFLQFPREAEATAARNFLMGISLPSVLNEREMLAMFYPSAQGTTSDPKDCQEWSAHVDDIITKVLGAFRSYESTPQQPPNTKD